MKHVILQSLTLENFKGEHSRTTTFNADITTIAGANGLGKSRHFDAFLWLLFGKDKENRADYEIKTHDASGNTLPEIDVVVTGVLVVGNETIKLTRKLVENWVTPKMSKERVFKGNETRCFWNDVPVTVTDYKTRVNNIIDETIFKMVTNPLFFASMDWKTQREQLFAMAGRVDDADIAGENADFRALLEKMNGKSFDDYKAEIRANKTNLRKELNEIQPRIDQTERMKPETCDWKALAKDLETVNAEIAELDSKIAEYHRATTDKIAAASTRYEEIKQLRADLFDCASRMDKIVNDAVMAERKRVNDLNKVVNDMSMELDNRKSAIDYREKRILTAGVQISAIEAQITKLSKEIEDKCAEWFDVNGMQYNTADDICPTCGQPIPDDMKNASRAKFAENKRMRLDAITADGKRTGERVNALKAELDSHNAQVATWRTELDELHTDAAGLEEKIASFKMTEESAIDPNTLPEWVNAKRVYDQLSDKIADAEKNNGTIDNSELDAKIEDCKTKKSEKVGFRDAIMTKLNNRTIIERADKEIAALEESGRKLAQEIADVERDEYIIGQFTKAKVDLVESRVSKLFTIVKFKMFNYTIDGNAIETCVAMVNGVPFPTANTASQINAGLDIINALCDYYDVTAPIFIDHRESVNTLIPTQSQIINLVVTTDPELVIS